MILLDDESRETSGIGRLGLDEIEEVIVMANAVGLHLNRFAVNLKI